MNKNIINKSLILALFFFLSIIVNGQYTRDLIKQNKISLALNPSFSSPDGNYLYINDNIVLDSLKIANTSFFAIERINITNLNDDSIRKLKLNPADLMQLGRLQVVQDIDEAKLILSNKYIESFKSDKNLKSDKEIVDYFKHKKSLNDYGIWYSMIETRRALGLIYLDKQALPGNKYMYFITRVTKSGKVESAGISIASVTNNGNYLLPFYFPKVANTSTQDSALLVQWKLPVNKSYLNEQLSKISKQKNYVPIPFGEMNVRGLVYLQTSLGWEQADLILPTINKTNDTLLFNYVAKATPEKYYKLYLKIEDEVHNKGNESDTVSIFVIDKNNLPFVKKLIVKDTINGIRLTWNQLPNKPYIESIEVSKSELKGGVTKVYLKPSDTAYTDYQVTVGKTYVYQVRTIFYLQTKLKQTVGAEGSGKFSMFEKPLSPTNLVAKNLGKHIQLNWEYDSIPGTYGFYVFRGTSFNNLALIDGPILSKKYIDSNSSLSGKSKYYYAVQAQNLRQQSSNFSNRVEIMPLRTYDIYKPSRIDFFYANNTLDLHWDDVSLQDTYIQFYLLQKKRSKDVGFINLAILPKQTHSFIDTNLVRGETYQYRIASITFKGDTSDFTENFEYGLKKNEVAILQDFGVRNTSEGIEIALPTLVYENRSGYKVYRRESTSEQFEFIAKLNADDFLFVDKKVKNNVYYIYSISIIAPDGREGKLSDNKAIKRDW